MGTLTIAGLAREIGQGPANSMIEIATEYMAGAIRIHPILQSARQLNVRTGFSEVVNRSLFSG
jgi:hypothetical protein